MLSLEVSYILNIVGVEIRLLVLGQFSIKTLFTSTRLGLKGLSVVGAQFLPAITDKLCNVRE